MATVLKTVWLLKGKTLIGHDVMALFENTAAGEKQCKQFRKWYPKYFKGKKKKLKSIIDLSPKVKFNQLYTVADFNTLQKQYQTKLKLEANAELVEDSTVTPAAPAKPKTKQLKRPPMQGDYLQIAVGGKLVEDFTFIREMIADHGDDTFMVLDMYGKEVYVEAFPERDHGERKAFRQVLTQ